ncbi:heavy metal-binding protein HIP-like isoform X2 [Saccostrea echinata]|uniref:heavy metal-binding protein HIP-like isoform X2 n=1 Tax=Saccostrea echinata TaxID=191078 RepID=UPI002A80E8A2|nr:heavy metal-binding protein HIP-like isoform X2 [Saccostrea echinata]
MLNMLKTTLLLLCILVEVCTKGTHQDFISKFNKYNSVCQGIGYKTMNCSGTEKNIIAFNTLLSKRQENLGKSSVVVFGNIILNTGNAYDGITGKFTAPEHGIYSFSWTILTTTGKYFHTEIVLNGNIIGYNHVDGTTGSSHYSSGSSSAIIKMKKNDKVWIRTHGDHGKFAYENWSSFSGFKL